MYECSPKPKLLKEKLTVGALALLAAISYGCGNWLPVPVVYQLLAVLCLTWAVFWADRYLLRDYSTALSEDGDRRLVLTVTELHGKRRTAVARFLAHEIKSVMPSEAETIRRLCKQGRSVYRYVSELCPKEAYLLEAESNGQTFWVEFYADETLIGMLEEGKKQYLSDI